MGSSSSPAPQSVIDELVRQVRELQDRVFNLERRLGEPLAAPAVSAAPLFSEEVPALPDTASTLTVLGRSLLGIAGAYLLRALTESGTLPQLLGVALGTVYAAGWLIFAARTPAEKTLSVTMSCLTSVLVLAPLLWEATLRFQVLSSWMAAGTLVLFSAFGLAISWRKNLSIIAWVTTLAGMGTAAALLIATRDVLPFTLALLAVAAAIEFSACCDHWVGERWIAATLTDLAILLMTFLLARRGGLPEGYVHFSLTTAIGVQIGLLAVYLASAVVRTLYRKLDFTVFEILQLVAAFVLCIGGALKLAAGQASAVWATGAFALVSGSACYVVAFAVLERQKARAKNFYSYSTFGILIVLAGSMIVLSGVALVAFLSVLALSCLWLGVHFGRSTVRLHGAIYVLLAALAAGTLGSAAANLLKSGSGWTYLTAAGWLGAAVGILAYPIAVRTGDSEKTHWVERTALLLVAVNFVWTLALLTAGLPHYVWNSLDTPGKAGMAAATQTAVLTLIAVALAWFGRRSGRTELTWLVYPMMGLTGYRMLLHDFPIGNTLALFASLLLYGGAMVLLPKIMARPRKVFFVPSQNIFTK